MNRGVYFLADDGVIDLTLTFLNSFRRHNPELPLCLIPFNENVAQLNGLRHQYDFSIFGKPGILNKCDAISERFHGRVMGHYRKLAAWEGEFDQFMYIDVDTVVLAGVGFAFRFLSEYDFITSHSHLPELVQWVWKPSIRGTGQLTEPQIAFSANTGFITSNRDALRLDRVIDRLEAALGLSPHMALAYKEQPLLNYLIVTSGRKYTSLLNLMLIRHSTDILLEAWAGLKGGVVVDGDVRLPDGTRPPLFLIHWAGSCQPRRADRVLFQILRMLQLKRETDRLMVRFFMPYRELWDHYRFLSWEKRGAGGAASTEGEVRS